MSEAIASKAERLAAYNANIAAAEKDPSLSPGNRQAAVQDERRTFRRRLPGIRSAVDVRSGHRFRSAAAHALQSRASTPMRWSASSTRSPRSHPWSPT